MSAGDSLAELLLALFEKSGDGALVLDAERRIVFASPSAASILRVPAHSLPGRNIVDFITDDGHAQRWASLAGGRPLRFEVVARAGDGAHIALEIVVTPNVLPGRHMSVLRDISERRERELLSERYELLARHTHDIVLFLDELGGVIEANEAAERTYGYSHAEILRLNVRTLRASHTLFDFEAQLVRAGTTGVLFETEHCRKDGSIFPVEVGSRSAVLGGRRILLSIVRDITERRLMQARLVQADRLGAFGMIAAGVAHEINNPLAYALNNLEMLARRVPQLGARLQHDGPRELVEEMAQLEQMLQTAREGMERVRHITRDLKTFSRGDSEPHEGVDVRSVLESALNLARGDLRHRASLVRDYGDVRLLRGNASRLGQVFLNLLVNAAQAIPVSRRTPSEIRVVTRMDGDNVIVDVMDDGVGIPPELVERIFEPFITTKPEGTGLGLHIARSTVREHGGDIHIFAREGGGTIVRVVMPASAVNSAPTRPSDRARELDARWRVLVIDDEVTIGVTLREVLAALPDVTVVSSGEDALRLFEAEANRFDVVLCDLMMPGMNGKNVYERVAQRWPDVARRFLFMTGGATTVALQEFLRATPVPCLTKPFTSEELERSLRGVVSASA